MVEIQGNPQLLFGCHGLVDALLFRVKHVNSGIHENVESVQSVEVVEVVQSAETVRGEKRTSVESVNRRRRQETVETSITKSYLSQRHREDTEEVKLCNR